MKVLVLGAGGLIGHKLFQLLRSDTEVYAALHHTSAHPLFGGSNIFSGIDVLEFDRLTQLIGDVNADVILNCVGITKRNPNINDLELTIATNAHFPHRLASWAKTNKKRVIHFSTDCVFDGTAGPYSEHCNTTALDIYGKTKALGEIDYPHTLTVRSSFIGRELKAKTELLEWALSCRGKTIRGFDKAYYSGVSTICMARVIKRIIVEHQNLSGLYQLATDKPISKLALLNQINHSFQLGMKIETDSSFETRPTLIGTRLKSAINLAIPSWKDMLDELAAERIYENAVEQVVG